MLRGTRLMFGNEAKLYIDIIEEFRRLCRLYGFSEIILPSIWEQETFIEKAGEEILGQMYTFKDKADRAICLIPEATAIIQKVYKEELSKSMKKPVKLFYVQRCYRYERPQAGRYREFTQFGVEILGGKSPEDKEECIKTLRMLLDSADITYTFKDSVKRGLSYYIEDGFEVECEDLGAQKQIAGGGRYDCGIGFAIGIDRLVLRLS